MKVLRYVCALVALLASFALAGCGGSSPAPRAVSQAAKAACPQVASGKGKPGACAPAFQRARPLARPIAGAFAAFSGQQVADLSNNDPCYCGGSLRRQGYSGLIVKANQGNANEFLDSTAVAMVSSARAAGLAVGVYDFDQDYTIAEAQALVQQAHAAGIFPGTRNAFPLYLDVEYGNFSYGGLVAQVNYLRGLGYRVGIYTGEWYYSPHAGCRFPVGLTSLWLSGYPNASVPCGAYAYNLHQFTDSPFDRSVFIGNSWAGLINAGPPPDPWALYSKIVHRWFHDHASEHGTVSTWDNAKCKNPVRRFICKTTHYHLEWLKGYLEFISWNVLGKDHKWHKLKHPNYHTGSPAPRGYRHYGLDTRLHAR